MTILSNKVRERLFFSSHRQSVSTYESPSSMGSLHALKYKLSTKLGFNIPGMGKMQQ